ncbi:hypothetical protein GCM10022286_02250 [Gryllotalpicola daejeonensis]|uniref:Uncharacterized protein n=1 Tax=Gryllotalpicola daejeonensis TaxID=993087 RepID=A0ABP7ZH81_9MICO
MAQNDDDLSQIEADDALLSAVAEGRDEHGVTDDPAAALLADIVRTVDALSPNNAPNESPGGSGRRGRRRGGLWGISLGVSIVVAAGGGLSAAATDRLPEPMQRFAVEVGQAAPPAAAEQVVVTPTEIWPQSAADASGDGLPYRYLQPGDASWQDPQSSSWWQGAQAEPGVAGADRHSGADAFTYGAPMPSGDRPSTWGDSSGSWSGGYGTGSGWGGDPVGYPYAQTSPYTSPYSSSYPQPMGYSEPTPTKSASPQPSGSATPTPPRETSGPTSSPAPSRGSGSPGSASSPSPRSSSHGQASGSKNPSPSSHASPHATSSAQQGKRTYGYETPRSSH